MKYVLTIFIATVLIFLTSCGSLFPPVGKTSVETAQELVDEFLERLNTPTMVFPDPSASPTEFLQLALNFVYIPQADRDEEEVRYAAAFLLQWIAINFILPSTVTEAKVLAAAEHSVKIPQLLSDPPNFVQKVYTLVIEGETAVGSVTSITLPMITVQNQAYFYTAFVKQTGSTTDVSIYPEILGP
ncbi:hypothetical protein [Pseudothermotoga sp.]|uniref:hypothetical protein n=1 Tax=Pseudothermotoga sp. TaxID=2033661 RepID=UPI0031F6713C